MRARGTHVAESACRPVQWRDRSMAASGATHEAISMNLLLRHLHKSGYSARSDCWYCSSQGIHYRSRLTDPQLDRLVSAQIQAVGHSYGRRILHCLLSLQVLHVSQRRLTYSRTASLTSTVRGSNLQCYSGTVYMLSKIGNVPPVNSSSSSPCSVSRWHCFTTIQIWKQLAAQSSSTLLFSHLVYGSSSKVSIDHKPAFRILSQIPGFWAGASACRSCTELRLR